MSTITDVKCILYQRAFDVFVKNFIFQRKYTQFCPIRFACPVRFRWNTTKNVTRDPAPVADDFNAQDYVTLVAHPSPFWKFLEKFLCLVGLSRHYTLDEETYTSFLDKDGEDMDIFAFIRTTNPTKVKVAKRERREDEPRLLETTISRTIPLLPVAPDRGKSELDASVDKLFDEGGSYNTPCFQVIDDVDKSTIYF
ncbi:hypothetical protein Tco_0733063 [Tanacetum coccineum]